MTSRGRFGISSAVLYLIGSFAHAIASPAYSLELPVRPVASDAIMLAVGTVESYELRTSPFEERLTLLKADGHTITVLLSRRTTIDGKAFKCEDRALAELPASITSLHLCPALPPSIILKQTRIAMLYWKDPVPSLLSTGYGADQLVAIP